MEEKKKRKQTTMEYDTKARLSPSQRAMLDELIEAYSIDESEIIRRMILYIHKRRPALNAETATPKKMDSAG